MSKDLLKEAIADAKAVRQTAIANAKLALEEAFTPKLQSMLSTKIREEYEDEEEEEEVPTAEMAMDSEEETDPVAELTADEEDTEVEGMYDEDAEMAPEEDDAEVAAEAEGEQSEDDLELEAILRELEAGTETDEDEVPVAEDAAAVHGGATARATSSTAGPNDAPSDASGSSPHSESSSKRSRTGPSYKSPPAARVLPGGICEGSQVDIEKH